LNNKHLIIGAPLSPLLETWLKLNLHLYLISSLRFWPQILKYRCYVN
jgi:hypothetical protein